VPDVEVDVSLLSESSDALLVLEGSDVDVGVPVSDAESDSVAVGVASAVTVEAPYGDT